jgi:hypothetical protein
MPFLVPLAGIPHCLRNPEGGTSRKAGLHLPAGAGLFTRRLLSAELVEASKDGGPFDVKEHQTIVTVAVMTGGYFFLDGICPPCLPSWRAPAPCFLRGPFI